jgi:hypothetical protein
MSAIESDLQQESSSFSPDAHLSRVTPSSDYEEEELKSGKFIHLL